MGVWDTGTHAPLGTTIAAGDGHTFTGAAFLGDGSTLATSGDEVRLWSAASGAELTPAIKQTSCGTGPSGCSVYTDGIESSPDGAMFATFNGGVARIWDSASHTTLGAQIEIPEDVDVDAVAFSPDGTSLATGVDEYGQVVRLWDTRTQKQIGDPLGKIVDHYSPAATAVAFSSDGAKLAAVVDGDIAFWWVTTTSRLGMSISSPTGSTSPASRSAPTGNCLRPAATIGLSASGTPRPAPRSARRSATPDRDLRGVQPQLTDGRLRPRATPRFASGTWRRTPGSAGRWPGREPGGSSPPAVESRFSWPSRRMSWYATLDLELSWSESAAPGARAGRSTSTGCTRTTASSSRNSSRCCSTATSERGDHVLDPFAGSGTTLVQALESGLRRDRGRSSLRSTAC